MDNFTLFDSHNDALLLFYNINGSICILLNLLAIYLIVFKSSTEMGKYRWYLLYYQAKYYDRVSSRIFVIILKYREIQNNTYISTRLIIRDCLVSRNRKFSIPNYNSNRKLVLFLSLKRKPVITLPNFVILSTDFAFCCRYICKCPLPTCTLFSHTCGSRSWIPHHQNGNLNFHVNLYFLKKSILE
uniref:Uncharacterized protein n=1 Tax=Heterorhabditis bacteriophora TaxID=37862 RepID=A0A1I7WW92_HETBA